jgi:hypothetical protein
MTAANVMEVRDRERVDAVLLAEARGDCAPDGTPVARGPGFAPGEPYASLHARTEGAALMVVGNGDDPTTAGLTGDWLRACAPCPVVVLDLDGRVVRGRGH